MMFPRKLFAIASAVLAVTVNGSPVEVAKRELQAVRSLYIPLDAGEKAPPQIQTLTILSTQRALGNVYFCVDNGFKGACKVFAVDDNVCNHVPSGFENNISSFGPDRGIACTLYEYVNFPVATERPTT
jgi:hypothetical protein